MTARRNAEPKVETFAEPEIKFFLKTEGVQFTFVEDANGSATGLIVRQDDGTLCEVITGQKIK